MRANGFVSLIVKPLTSRGPSHFYARSVWHDYVPAHDTIRRRRRARYGTALDSGHMSHRADASSLTTATDYDGRADGAVAAPIAVSPWDRVGRVRAASYGTPSRHIANRMRVPSARDRKPESGIITTSAMR